MSIIGLVGRSGSGKDTVAAMIAPVHLVRIDGHLVNVRKRVAEETAVIDGQAERNAYLEMVKRLKTVLAGPVEPEALRPRAVQVALADPMKVFLRQVYGWSFATLWGPSSYRNQNDANGVNPRKALQLLGTEWGRAQWEGTWVAAGLKFAHELTSQQHIKQPGADAHTFAPNWLIDRYDTVVFSDVRFQNEVDMIHAAGGRVWQILRQAADKNDVDHASEAHTEMTGIDDRLVNEGTFDDLRNVVRCGLEKGML